MYQLQVRWARIVIFLVILAHCIQGQPWRTVYSWGDNTNGQLGNSFSQPRVQDRGVIKDARLLVSAASFYFYENGSIAGFGPNSSGQLGVGDKQPRLNPTLVTGLGTNIVEIVGSVDGTFALTREGRVYSFGDNSQGRLGHGNVNEYITPTLIPSLRNVTSLSAGVVSTHFITSNGSFWNLGGCTHGSFGMGDCTIIAPFGFSVPTLNPLLLNLTLVKVSAGSYHVLVLTNTSVVYGWGFNSRGQLGIGSPFPEMWIAQLVPITGVTQIQAHDRGSCFLKGKIGEIWCTGNNDLGSLGTGDFTSSTVPRKVIIPGGGRSGDLFFTSGYVHHVAWNSSGEAWFWGANQQGQLGLNDIGGRNTPFKHPFFFYYQVEKAALGVLSTILFTRDKIILSGGIGQDNSIPSISSGLYGDTVKIATKFQHTLAYQLDSTILAMGNNGNGQVIGTDTFNRLSPVRTVPQFGTGIKDVCISARNNLFLTKTGNVYTVGSNDNGQSGAGSQVGGIYNPRNVLSPHLMREFPIEKVACGTAHNAMITNTSRIYFVGDNDYGQFGYGAADPDGRSNATLVPNLSNVVDAALGERFSLVLTSNGTVYVAGSNVGGLTGLNTVIGDTLTMTRNPYLFNITMVRAGRSHSMAIALQNTTYAWGGNNFGQLCLGDTVSRSIPTLLNLTNLGRATLVDVSLGERFSLFLTSNNLVYSCGNSDQGQLGLGDYTQRLVPTLIPSLRRIESISAAWTYAFAITLPCSNGSYIGVDCNIPVCNRIPATDRSVCSGTGTCVAPNTCQCLLPSTGTFCESTTYTWRGSTGSWTSSDFWMIQTANSDFDALVYPSTMNHAVRFRSGTNSRISMKGLSLEIGSLSFETSSNVNLVIESSNLTIHDTSTTTVGSTVEVTSSSVNSRRNFELHTSSWTDSTLEGVFDVQQVMNLASRVELKKTTLQIQPIGKLKIDNHLKTSESTIINRGSIDLTQAGFSTPDSTSSLLNFGTISNFGSQSPCFLLIPVINANSIEMTNTTLFIGSYNATSNANFFSSGILNVTNLEIPNGNMILGGVVNGNMDFKSMDGTLKFIAETTFNGNLTLQSTIFFTLSPLRTPNFVTVTGLANLTNGLFLLTPEEFYNPFLNDTISFMRVGSTIWRKGSPILYLLGSPFKNAEIFQDGGSNELAFRITTSIGSAATEGYTCHYLRDQKTLEWNALFNKIMISFTTPSRSSQIGFGFDRGGYLNDSLLVLSDGKSIIQQFQHENISVTRNNYIVAASTRSVSFFGSWRRYYRVGSEYSTINILVPRDFFANQKKFYYAEINTNASTNASHYIRSYEFQLLTSTPLECTNLLQPTRAETYELGVFITYLIFYVIIFILCLILRRKRPLNTRGISPGLTTLILFIQLLLEVRNYAEVPEFQGSLCFYYAFSIYPLQVLLYLILMYYTFRYFSIIHLNQIKNAISQTKEKQVSKLQNVLSRVLKVFSLRITMYLFTITALITILFVFFIVLASYSFICKFDTLVALKLVQTITLLIIYSITILILVVDMILNWRMIVTCKLIQYIFFKDPYWYRAQYLLLIPFMIYSICVDFIAFGTSFTYKSIVENFGMNIVLNTIQAFFLLLLVVMIPLVISIINIVYKFIRGKKKKITNNLDLMIKDPKIREMFYKFCKREYSLENLVCYEEIIEFKANPVNPLPIYFKYFNGIKSIMEVNVSKKECQAVFEKIKAGMIDATLFVELEPSVLRNLSDTFSRFQFEQEYVDYVQGKLQTREMIEEK